MQGEIEPPSNYYSLLDILLYFTVLFLQIRLVHNIRSGKPRGFAFVEYEHERDMHCKYTSSKTYSQQIHYSEENTQLNYVKHEILRLLGW